MKKKALTSIGLISFFSVIQPVHASIVQDVTKGLGDFVANHAWHYYCKTARYIADLCVQGLFMVYGWLGSRLLYIPDVTDKGTYMGVVGVNASGVVQNAVNVMEYLGFFLLAVLFIFYMGRMALGISGQTFTFYTIGRLLLPIFLLFAWPYLVSQMAKICTNLGYYIYDLNPYSTKDVLQGLNNFNAPSAGGGGITQTSPHKYWLGYELSYLKLFAFALSTLLAAIGIKIGLTRIHDGKGGGYQMILTAVAALFMIYFTPTLITYFSYTGGVANVGSTSIEPGANPLQTNTGVLPVNPQSNPLNNLPNETFQNQSVNLPAGPTQALPGPGPNDQYDPNQDTFQDLCANLIKFFVSVWGIFIVIGVLIAKCYQVISILVLFLLGFPIIGCLGHPATEHIPINALKLFIKLNLYAPMWALALLVLNIVIYMNWGPEGGGGAGSIMTTFTILAGLSIIQNAQDFANIFTNFHWGVGGSAHGFMKDAMGSVRTAALGVGAVTGEFGQRVGKIGGGTVGSALGGSVGALAGIPSGQSIQMAKAGANLGKKVGGAVGEHSTKAMNAVANSLTSKKRGTGVSKLLNEYTGGGGQDTSGGGPSKVARSISADGTRVNFTKGGWPTAQGYANINKKLGTNFDPTPLNDPKEYAKRDAEWRKSITGSDEEWLSKPEPGYSQARWKSILENTGKA
jgi:hypothetical protein